MTMKFDLQRFAVFNNSDEYETITGTATADTITNSANNVVVKAGNGNDSVYSSSGNFVSLNGDNGTERRQRHQHPQRRQRQ